MKHKNKIAKQLTVLVAVFFVGFVTIQANPKINSSLVVAEKVVKAESAKLADSMKLQTVKADTRDQGTDWAVYQGAYGRKGYSSDKFAISQIGGSVNGGIYNQSTYGTQVASGIAQGLRMHTYVWDQVGDNLYNGTVAMNYFLSRIQTPKGSIVALDYEDGASSWDIEGNTNVILSQMAQIKQAGYTPMYYSYKPYTLAHVDYQRINAAYPNSLWIAAYPDYQVRSKPYYGMFPSMDGIAIWQFTSTYAAGGLDGNVDLTGITNKGYTKADNPKTNTPAVDTGKQVDNTPKRDIKVGDAVKVNFSAKNWATGQAIPSNIKGQSYKVQQVSGNKVLLSGVYSWINKSDVELVNNDKPIATPNTSKGTKDALGDTWYSEKATFKLSQNINLRWGARTSSAVIATLPAGSSIKYDQVSTHGGYVWLRQPRGNGQYAYIATGQAVNGKRINSWGTFK